MKYSFLCVLLIAACLSIVPSDARGGRGRGGGSVGGLFGGWRKYKKPASSGSGRRVMSGSPVHTAMTVPKPPPAPSAVKPMTAAKPQMASYPRQQMPTNYNYPMGAGNPPAQGTYHANAQTLPAGAIFYQQPPMRSGTGDFLTGMLAGHMMNSLMFSRRHHVSHVHQQNQNGEASAQGNGREIIVINNGEQEQGQQQQELWPMATDVQLAPINETLLTEEATSSDEDSSAHVASASQELQSGEADSEDVATAAAVPMDLPPSGGIICFPIMVNETDAENAEEVHEVERIVCFPAPTEPMDCKTVTVLEADPADPSKTIEVERQECTPLLASTTTTTVPPIVAGDIGGTVVEDVASYVAGRAATL